MKSSIFQRSPSVAVFSNHWRVTFLLLLTLASDGSFLTQPPQLHIGCLGGFFFLLLLLSFLLFFPVWREVCVSVTDSVSGCLLESECEIVRRWDTPEGCILPHTSRFCLATACTEGRAASSTAADAARVQNTVTAVQRCIPEHDQASVLTETPHPGNKLKRMSSRPSQNFLHLRKTQKQVGGNCAAKRE